MFRRLSSLLREAERRWWMERPRLSALTKRHISAGLAAIALRKGCAHLHVSSYQVRWLLVRLQGDVDGGEGPAGHLLHLPQQLLGRRRKEEEEGEGQRQVNTDGLLSILQSTARRVFHHQLLNRIIKTLSRRSSQTIGNQGWWKHFTEVKRAN